MLEASITCQTVTANCSRYLCCYAVRVDFLSESLVQYVSDSSFFHSTSRARESRARNAKKISSVRRMLRDSSISSTRVLSTADFMNEMFFFCSRIIIRSSKKGNVLQFSFNYEMKTFSMLRKRIPVNPSGNN